MLRAVRPWLAAITLVAAAAATAGAVDGDDDPNVARDPSYVSARQAIRSGQYTDAIRLLNEALARDPHDADTHNMLGFAFRKRGDLDRAFAHYREALRLAPDHRGVHEYIGEAYSWRAISRGRRSIWPRSTACVARAARSATICRPPSINSRRVPAARAEFPSRGFPMSVDD